MVEQENLTAAVRDGRAALNKYRTEMDDLEGEMKGFSTGNEENADSLTSMLGPLDDVLSGIEDLAGAYNEAYEDAMKSVYGQYSLWEKATETIATSTDDIASMLDSQIGYWSQYSDNLENLMGRNIDGLDAMVQAVADGSEESAAYIAGLANASDEDLAALVAQFQSLREAQDTAKEDIANVQSNFDQAMKRMVDSAKSAVGDMKLTYDARQAAIQTVNSYINAADGMVGKVRAAYSAVASAARDALQYGNMTVITRTNGENIGRVGYADGTDYATPGWHWVGEEGPEPVYFTGGEKVISHTKAVEMLQGGDKTQVINVTLSPSYQITGTGNTEDIRAILEEHDRALPGKVTAILREAERDAVRRSYS
jgi:phage-related tail protein